MIRVLIADDEEKVCQLIRYLVHWEDYDMEIIGTVNDGQAALEMIREEKPDLVITDIRMPGIDGLKLVEEALLSLGQVYFVIISGYSQFEYARQAVQLGVENYLVKPVRKKELDAVLRKIREKYHAEVKNREEKKSLIVQLSHQKEQIKNNCLRELLFEKELPFADISVERLRERYGISFCCDSFFLLLTHFYRNTEETHPDEIRFVLEKMYTILSDNLKPLCGDYLSLVSENNVICLLNMDAVQEEQLKKMLSKCRLKLSEIREILPKAETVSVLSERMPDPGRIREHLEAMQKTLFLRFENPKAAYLEEAVFADPGQRTSFVSQEDRKEFLRQLELLDEEQVGELIDSVAERLLKQPGMYQETEEVYREIVSLFLLGARNYYHDLVLPDAGYFRDGYEMFFDLRDVFFWLRKEITGFMVKQEERQREMESRPIREAKQYIHAHFCENVRLEDVSRVIGLNPAYLSAVFKKETGQNFMDYVTAERMEYAKTQLIHTGKDVIDVAYESGYSDVKYFSRQFKKYTSLTPTEYRKLYN